MNISQEITLMLLNGKIIRTNSIRTRNHKSVPIMIWIFYPAYILYIGVVMFVNEPPKQNKNTNQLYDYSLPQKNTNNQIELDPSIKTRHFSSSKNNKNATNKLNEPSTLHLAV